MKRRSALLGLTAAIAAPRVALRAQGLTKLRTLALPVDQCGALFYAKELGYFERAGLDVDLSFPTDYGAVISATVGGSADISYGIIVALEQAFAAGLPITIVAGAAINDQRHPNNYFIVAKDSPIKSARDLNGKTLGTAPLKSLGTYAVEAYMSQHGGDPSTIKWAEIPFPLCGAAIGRGTIDGAFVVEPFATAARATTRNLFRAYEAISPLFLGAAYFTTTAWAKANPDTLRRFQTAIHEASVWGNSHHTESAVILEKYSKVDPDTLAHMVRSIYADAVTPQIVQPSIDFCAKYKMISAGFSAKDLIYSSQV
jgi:NitT/TauT family transport system substrate-binding protein